jgi:hypothetical protein
MRSDLHAEREASAAAAHRNARSPEGKAEACDPVSAREARPNHPNFYVPRAIRGKPEVESAANVTGVCASRLGEKSDACIPGPKERIEAADRRNVCRRAEREWHRRIAAADEQTDVAAEADESSRCEVGPAGELEQAAGGEIVDIDAWTGADVPGNRLRRRYSTEQKQSYDLDEQAPEGC